MSTTDRNEALSWVLGKIAAAKKATPSVASSIPKPPEFKPTPLPSFSGVKPLQTPEQKRKELQEKKDKELELWHTWKQSGHDPQHLDPLLKSMDNLIQSQAGKYKNRVEIPTAAIDFEFKKNVVKALKSYDPDKGAKLSTWVTANLKKSDRFIGNTQNFARIPENIRQHIGKFNAAKADLTERLGHEPDSATIAEETGLPMKTVIRLNKEQRKGLIAAGQTGLDFNPTVGMDAREREVVELIYHQLSPTERIVHEYTFGLNGKPKLPSGQIAKTLKWDNSKVSKLRTSILKKMKPYLTE